MDHLIPLHIWSHFLSDSDRFPKLYVLSLLSILFVIRMYLLYCIYLWVCFPYLAEDTQYILDAIPTPH